MDVDGLSITTKLICAGRPNMSISARAVKANLQELDSFRPSAWVAIDGVAAVLADERYSVLSPMDVADLLGGPYAITGCSAVAFVVVLVVEPKRTRCIALDMCAHC